MRFPHFSLILILILILLGYIPLLALGNQKTGSTRYDTCFYTLNKTTEEFSAENNFIALTDCSSLLFLKDFNDVLMRMDFNDEQKAFLADTKLTESVREQLSLSSENQFPLPEEDIYDMLLHLSRMMYVSEELPEHPIVEKCYQLIGKGSAVCLLAGIKYQLEFLSFQLWHQKSDLHSLRCVNNKTILVAYDLDLTVSRTIDTGRAWAVIGMRSAATGKLPRLTASEDFESDDMLRLKGLMPNSGEPIMNSMLHVRTPLIGGFVLTGIIPSIHLIYSARSRPCNGLDSASLDHELLTAPNPWDLGLWYPSQLPKLPIPKHPECPTTLTWYEWVSSWFAHSPESELFKYPAIMFALKMEKAMMTMRNLEAKPVLNQCNSCCTFGRYCHHSSMTLSTEETSQPERLEEANCSCPYSKSVTIEVDCYDYAKRKCPRKEARIDWLNLDKVCPIFGDIPPSGTDQDALTSP